MSTNKTNDVNELREQLESLRTQHEIAQLTREIAMLGTSARAQEIAEAAIMSSVHTGYLYDSPNESPIVHRSTFGDYLPDVLNNRERGQDAVVFTSDGELAESRGIGRTLAWIDETSAGVLRTLCRYIVGTGFDTEIAGKVDRKAQLRQIKERKAKLAAERLAKMQQPQEPQAPVDEAPTPAPTPPASAPTQELPLEDEIDPEHERRDAIAARANEIVDEAFKLAKWRRTLIAELVKRFHRDGEFFIRVVADKAGRARIKILEPAEFTEPANPQALEAIAGETLDWSFGIGTRPGDTSDVVAYYRNWGTNADEWEVIPAAEIVHVKANVDSGVKRGVSDFYLCYRNIERQAKIARNAGSGAAIQAAIAFIREWTNPAAPGDISGRIGSSAGTGTAGNPLAAARTVRTQSWEEGTIVDTFGAKYHSGPLGQQHLPAVVQIADFVKRHFGILWGMPGWMLTGDASGTTSYASAFVTESPFVKNCEGEQEDLVDTNDAVVERILDIAVRAGQFAEWGIRKLEDLLREIAVHTERPSVAVRNRAEENDVYSTLYEKKGVSLRTWVTKMGLDWEQEQVFRDEEPEPEKPPMPLPFGGGVPFGGQGPQGDDPPRPGMPMAESEDVREAGTDPEGSETDDEDDETPAVGIPQDPPTDETPPEPPTEPPTEPSEDPPTEPTDEDEDDEDEPQERPQQMAGETVREWLERTGAPRKGEIDVNEDESPVGNEIPTIPTDLVERLDLTDEATRIQLAAKLLWSGY